MALHGARRWLLLLAALLTSLLSTATWPANTEQDPLDSFMWKTYRERFLGDTLVRFDDRVKISAPEFAENSGQVPVDVNASAFDGNFETMLLWVELNPIPLVFEYHPLSQGLARVSLNVRLEQSSPVRAAVLSDGVWHVGSTTIEGRGGGCSTPNIAKSGQDWSKDFGQVSARAFPQAWGNRVRVKLIHPMDSGLIPSVSEFYVQQVRFEHHGEPVARMQWHASVSENPRLTIGLRGDSSSRYRFIARDNNANVFEKDI